MATSQGRLAELAVIIADHTQRIHGYLTERGLPQPSFYADGPVDLSLTPELEKSRLVVLGASQELNDLLQGPRDLVTNHQHNQMLPLHFISRFSIAKEVPIGGDITYQKLAAKIGVDCGVVTSILRFGITNRLFNEPRPGVIAHSAASKQIATDSRVADWVGSCVDEMWPAAVKTVDALQKWPSASEPNQTGFSLSHETSESFYAEMGKVPERARRFGGAMSLFTTGEGFALRHLTDGYAWSSLGTANVVDIGGSHGDAAFALARKFPDLHLVVEELPEVVASSTEVPGLNVQFKAHDFFTEQPIKHADVYLYRWILHNWPDAYCLKILRALVPALKKGARLLIMDTILPPPGLLPNILEKKLRAIDLTMLEIGNAKERDLNEWKELLRQADSRFVFRGMTQPPGSNLGILEAVWEGEDGQ